MTPVKAAPRATDMAPKPATAGMPEAVAPTGLQPWAWFVTDSVSGSRSSRSSRSSSIARSPRLGLIYFPLYNLWVKVKRQQQQHHNNRPKDPDPSFGRALGRVQLLQFIGLNPSSVLPKGSCSGPESDGGNGLSTGTVTVRQRVF